MDAFDKDLAIDDIQFGLNQLGIANVLQLMDKYGLPKVLKSGSFYESYVPKRLDLASPHQLGALTSYIKAHTKAGASLDEMASRLRDDNVFGLFISHSQSQEAEALALKEQFALGGVDCFVASDDIETSTEWLVEIVDQLEQMDGLMSLTTQQSILSATCNQEIGFALGAGKPVVSVMVGEAPQGLVGSTQAISWKDRFSEKDVALFVVEALMKFPQCSEKLTSLLVRQLVSYDQPYESFKVIGFCRKALTFSDCLTAGQIFELRKAVIENEQIARFASGRGPELIESLCVDFEKRAAVA